MQPDEARALLAAATDGEEPVILPRSVLSSLTAADLPAGVSVEVGTEKDRTVRLEWDGTLYADNGRITGAAEYLNTRKYWYAPLGLEHYTDLIRRAAEVRGRVHGDVSGIEVDDDGAYIRLSFSIASGCANLGDAFQRISAICAELQEAAESAVDQVGRQSAALASRVSGWGSSPLDVLVNTVQKAKSADERGRSLEELVSRLFESVPGFTVTDRIRTATEEIDISVLNASEDPRFKRESAIILAECKNWSDKCGKNEFVAFREKLLNRRNRASLGYLISWNGFARTVDKELLRGSRESVIVVPVTGKDVRAAMRAGDFAALLASAWGRAIAT